MADWTDSDWDPEREKAEARKKATSLGLTWEAVNGLVRDEWALFEVRMAAWSRRVFNETGVAPADWQKTKHRSKFRALLVRTYGIGDVDLETPIPLLEQDEIRRRFIDRAEREFRIDRLPPPNPREAEAFVALAREAMVAKPVAEIQDVAT